MGITHLAYADDLLLFSRVDGPSVSILSDCLDTLGIVRGLGLIITSLFLNVSPGGNHAYKFFRPTRQKVPWASVVWFGAPIFCSSMSSRYGYVHRDDLLPDVFPLF